MKVRDIIKQIRKDGWAGTGRAEEMKYAAVFETEHNWAAYVPDLPGCVTTGVTLEDTRRLIAEAIVFHIEGLTQPGSLNLTRVSRLRYPESSNG